VSKNNIQGEQKGTLVENLPNGWTMCRLGDVMRLKDGYAFKSKDYSSDGIPLVRISDINNGKVTLEKAEHIPENKANFAFVIQPGDLLIAMSGATTGKTGIYNGGQLCLQNQRVGNFKIISEDTVDKKYRNYYIASLRKEIEKAAYGGAQPNISAKGIEAFDFPLAPLNEQKYIVAKIEKQFSRLDEAVANLKRVKANLKRYKASVLKAAVEGKLTEEWRKKHPNVEPADKLLQRILAERRKKWEEAELAKMKAKGKVPKDDKWKKKYKEPPQVDESLLPALPNGWAWSNLPQLGELNRGKSKHRPRNAPFLYGGPYPFIQTGDVRHATGIINQYSQTYSEEGLKQSRLWTKGTLCITIAANIADTALLGFDACFPDSIVGFIPENENIDVRFIEYFVRTAKEDLERYAPATAQKNINLSILSDVAVPLPPEEEQHIIIDEIEKCLTIAEGIEFDVEQNMRRAERLRQSILKKAFSGKLVQPILGEEPVAVLLERIRRERRKKEKTQKPAAKKGKRIMTVKDTYLTLEEVDADHLSKILAQNGVEIDPKSLWQESKLTIDDFYAQLKREVEGNLIEETSERLLKLIA